MRKQLELGQVSTLAVLTTQQVYLMAMLTRVQALASRYADTAAAFSSARRRLVEQDGHSGPQEPLDLADVLRVTAPTPK